MRQRFEPRFSRADGVLAIGCGPCAGRVLWEAAAFELDSLLPARKSAPCIPLQLCLALLRHHLHAILTDIYPSLIELSSSASSRLN